MEGRVSYDSASQLVDSHTSGSVALSGQDIRIIGEPKQFYASIREEIGRAKSEISLSALYLGTGSLEKQLLADLDAAMDKEEGLRVTLVFDYNRAQRLWSGDLEGSVSVPQFHIILPLIQKYGANRVRLRLYKMPKLNASYYNYLPVQLREVLGVYHVKFLQFDDVVLLTGANLSNEYFTTRVDRYILFDRGMGPFVRKYIEIMEGQCHHVNADGTLKPPVLHDTQLPSDLNALVSTSATCRQTNGDIDTILFPLVQHATVGIMQESKAIPDILKELALLSSTGAATDTGRSSGDGSPRCTSLVFSSPYPSFTRALMTGIRDIAVTLFQQRASEIEPAVLISASRASHGFGGDTEGLKAVIPTLHDEILHASIMPVTSTSTGTFTGISEGGTATETVCKDNDSNTEEDAGAEDVLAVLKYDRAGWTFHSKGIWCDVVTPSNKKGKDGGSSSTIDASTMSYIGSSNMGERSAKRDMELGFMLVTRNPQLRASLRKEVHRVLSHCEAVTVDDLRGKLHEQPMRHLRLRTGSAASLLTSRKGVTLLARLLRSYL